MTTPPLPTSLIERTRTWAWEEFNFGEWQSIDVFRNYIRDQLGYTRSTPAQYAARFVARGVEHRDFETRLTRLNGRQWRWIVHPTTPGEPDADPEA